MAEAAKNPEMQRRGRMRALALHAHHSKDELNGWARKASVAFNSKFESMVPDDVTDPDERARRAHYLRQLHFADLGRRSAAARRQRAAHKPSTTVQAVREAS
jgi:hypothetical protein